MRWLGEPIDAAERALREGLDLARQRTGDEIARRRLWTRLAQPELFEAPRRRWPFLVGGALVAAGAAALLLAWPFADRSTADRSVAVAAERPGPAASGTLREEPVLQAPATISTAVGERRKVVLRGGALATVSENSVLAIDAGGRPLVQKGEILLEVEKQPRGRKFTVAAGPYVIVVVGTRFRVWRASDGEGVGVAVEEGVVEVWNGSERVVLVAGRRWESPFEKRRTGARPPSDAKTQATKQEQKQEESRQASRPNAGSRLEKARLALVDRVPARAAHAVPPASGATPSVGDARSLAGGAGSSAVAVAPLVAVPAQQLSVDVPMPPAVAQPVVLTASERFKEAQAALQSGDPDRAAQIFGSLAQGQGPTSENAAYEQGRVLRDHLLRPREAVKAWSRYRARFPRGLLGAEAHLSIVETLVTLGDKDGALAEAESFVKRFPESERRAEVTRVAAELRRSAAATRPVEAAASPSAP